MSASTTLDPIGLAHRWRDVVPACFAAATVAVATSQIRTVFSHDFHVLPLVLIVLAASTVAWVLREKRIAVRIVAMVAVAIGGAALAGWSTGASMRSTLRDVPHGIGDVIATVYPAPVLAGGVGALGGLAALAGALAVELTARRRTVIALVPSLVVLGLVALLGAAAGPPSAWVLGAYVAAAIGLLRQRTPTNPSRISAMLAIGVAVLVGCTTVAVATVTTGQRYDPRSSSAPAALPDVGISPLSRLAEWRNRTPVTTLFTSSLPEPARWRLVALTRYDGRAWMPADDYRAASSQVGPTESGLATTDVTVTLGDLGAPWLPAPDRPVEVSLPVRLDGGRSGLYTEAGLVAGTQYDLRFQVPRPPDATALASAARTRGEPSPFVEGFSLPAELQQLAETVVAGATSDDDRAQRIASYLRSRYELDDGSPPGHSFAVEQLFLQRTMKGRDEQFVSAFAILAAAVGLPVRIAVGFDSSVDEQRGTTIVASNQTVAWAEVEFDGLGWVPFDPLPASRTGQTEATLPQGAGQPASAGAPTVISSPSSTPQSPPPTRDDPASTPPPEPRGRVLSSAAVALALVVAAAVCLVAYVAFVLIAKRRRRRRRFVADDPRERAIGAFHSGVDLLVDLGARTRRSMTDRELVAVGRATVGEVAERLEPVARLATEAVFGDEPATEDVDRAWVEIDAFERETVDDVGRTRALRASISTRSLRQPRRKG